MLMTGGQALARQLVLEGITDLFGIPGAQLDWACDGLHEVRDKLRYVVPRHEQTASYMADGYARTSGRIGACMVVPGPGLLNAMSGLATAWSCNSRVLAIVGQIPLPAIGKGYGLLHEIQDQSSIIGTATKWHALARSPQDVPVLIREAVRQLRTGRPRPVAVEIPPDILQGKAEVALVEPPSSEDHRQQPQRELIAQAAEMLSKARFPVVYAGGGALASGASAELERVADKLQAPVVMSDYGRGVLSDRHPLALTTLGGRAVFPHADVVLVVGSRFADATSPAPSWPQDKVKFIYLNTDPLSWAPPRVPTLAIQADAKLGLAALDAALDGARRPSRAADIAKVRAWCEKQLREVEPQWSWMQALRGSIPEDGILVQDLTQVCYYTRAFYPIYAPGTSITPGHQGTLGFSYPTSLGVAAANPGRAVVCATGDGGFGYGLAELATAAKYRLGVTALVFNNREFANVKNSTTATFGRPTGHELNNPDFGKLAGAFGVKSATIASAEELSEVLPRAIASREPWLIDAQVGDMSDPWHLVRLAPSGRPRGKHVAPPNPLGEPSH
jgi:acetolactate synthase-1/2/3 large subunit